MSTEPTNVRPGVIFISHSSKDKDHVEKVIRRIPKSHLFYDIDTIDPGQATADALDAALLTTDVFVLFVSPNTPKSIWVAYEVALAMAQKYAVGLLKSSSFPSRAADTEMHRSGCKTTRASATNTDTAI